MWDEIENLHVIQNFALDKIYFALDITPFTHIALPMDISLTTDTLFPKIALTMDSR